MAMLAERRERKRYNLVPRGKALYEDDNRFGTRMLEKMGWSKGKGLGANEDGAKEFVRIRYKNDSEGLGFEDRNDQWTQHEQSFDGLLKALNSGAGEDSMNSKSTEDDELQIARGFGFPKEDVPEAPKIAISGESLEEKSKKSRARVHYMKFTRGKDISRYSEKDLANIFGKKSFGTEEKQNIEKVEQPTSNESSQKTADNEEDQDSRFGVTIITTGTSINDYFKAKLEALRKKSKNSFKSDKGSAEEHKPEHEVENVMNEFNHDEKTKKKNKRKKSLDDGNVQEKTLNNEEESDKPIKKKKKLKTETMNGNESQMSSKSCTALISAESKSPEKDSTKSSRKQKLSDSLEIDEHVIISRVGKASKKKKSKRKGCSGDDSQPLDNQIEIISDVTRSEITDKNSKKSKRKVEKSYNEDSNLVCELPNSDEVIPQKKKKKSKKCDHNETTTQDLDVKREQSESTNQTLKEGKKSKKKRTLDEYSNAIELDTVQDDPEIPSNEKVKKSKKPKAKHEENEYLDSLSINTELHAPVGTTEHPLQKVSTSLPSATTSIDNEFRFPELKRKRQKKENHRNAPKIEISEQANPNFGDAEEELECQYKISSYSAEKFYNVDVGGFHGSNFEDIPGYGLNGRIKIEIKQNDIDAIKIKRFYSNVISSMRAENNTTKVKGAWHKREKTFFPRIPLL